MERERFPRPVATIGEITQRDLASAPVEEQDAALAAFAERLERWQAALASVDGGGRPVVSVEIPAFKGGWLIPCVESVLYQSSTCWSLTTRWDGGDALARRVLETIARLDHPRLRVHFGENRGIAYNRRFLTEHSTGDYILCLDDDDMLAPVTVERFAAVARAKPWSGIIRARREFIDETGGPVSEDTWFPFEPRHFQRGMVTDLFNHSQPALINRAAYDQTAGWEGFPEFRSAGEDCDIFLKVEEVAPVELLDEVLYYYRLSDRRTSLVLTNEAAFEMWRRLAEKSIERIGLPLIRTGDLPPYHYDRAPRPALTRDMVDFVVVDDGDATALRSTLAALGQCGAPADAIHVVAPATSPGAARNDALRNCSRPIVAYVAAGITLSSTTLDALLSAMDQHDADVAGPTLIAGATEMRARFDDRGRPAIDAAPESQQALHVDDAAWLPSRLLLLRREVARAVGGFDEAYGNAWYADADFCLKARLRDFRCIHVAGATVIDRGLGAVDHLQSDLTRLEGKWEGAPHLRRRPRAAHATGVV